LQDLKNRLQRRPVTKAAPAAPQDVAGSKDAVADEAAPKAKGGVAGRTDCGNTSGGTDQEVGRKWSESTR